MGAAQTLAGIPFLFCNFGALKIGRGRQRHSPTCIYLGMALDYDPYDTERERIHDVARQQRLAAPPRRSRAGLVLFLLFLFFVLGIAAMFALYRQSGRETSMGRLATGIFSGTNTFRVDAPDVVNQIQRLNRLETVSYSVDTVVEGNHTNAVLPDLLFGDRLLMVVHGQVVAGVDLSKLNANSVHINGRSITLDMPQSEIFGTRIDNTKTQVFARSTGLLTPADPHLETDTLSKAQNQILQTALTDGIMDTARNNARADLEGLLHGLGFETVTVR